MDQLDKEYIFKLCNEIATKTELFIDDCHEFDMRYPIAYAKDVYTIINQIMALL